MNTVRLVCAQCSDAYRVTADRMHQVRHWCWRDESTGLWCSMGWAVDE